ncbi:DMT family transporter [Pseudomaricurvus alkylphenolicus]|uniref:DMT family transporter n=1 Tax=Pseudomaricurvus alkylphenolicus TaxID=1306991 RepID=UPI00141F8357|nr:DMT family transporter [Pseudomaricurvus alkylphenolicus]NIB38093.1 DMT family transporter [Pseudomaricurvus alkylphenolicus]
MTDRRSEILLLVVAAIAAAGWILSKLALQEFEAHTFIAIRFALASLALTLFCTAELRSLSLNQIFRCLATGATMGGGLLMWVVALQLTDNVGEGAFIASLAVICVPLIGWLFFGEKITVSLVASLVPALAGLYYLAKDNMVPGQAFSLGTSQLLFLGSSLAFALHLNLSNHYVQNIPALALASLQLAMPAVLAGLTALLFTGKNTQVGLAEISSNAWLLLLASALLATSLRFYLQTSALQDINPTHAAMIFLAEPVMTVMLSAWWLGERMTVNQMLGCALIFSGVLFYRGAPLLRKRFR